MRDRASPRESGGRRASFGGAPPDAPAGGRRAPSLRRSRSRPRLRLRALLVLLGLLVGPIWALVLVSRLINGQYLAGYAVFISFLTYTLYRKDKEQAGCGGWRTPEATLHFVELIGGWPAAFLMQRLIRHKIVKRWYQINFWAIVCLHQYVAIDFVQNWRCSRAALVHFGTFLSHYFSR